MESIENRLQELQIRFDRLEKQNRRWKRGALGVALIVGCVLAMGQASPSRTIEGEELLLHDSSGTVRVRISATDRFGPLLDLYGEDGKSLRVRLNGTAESSGLVLTNRKQIMMLDESSLTISEGMSPRVVLNGSGENAPSLALTDADGFSAAAGSTETVTTKTGEKQKRSAASVMLFGKDGKVLWSAP